MAYVTCCTVLVVCKAIYDNSNTAGAVAFVDDVFVVVLVTVAGSLFDNSVNVVIGNVILLSLCNEVTQL